MDLRTLRLHYSAGILALLLVVPVVAAGFEPEIDIRSRAIDSFTINLDNAPVGNLVTRNITIDQPYSYEPIQHTVIVHISLTVTFLENDDGIWRYAVANEDGDIPDCEWDLETTTVGGFLAGESTKYPPFGVTCLFRQSTKPFPHDHTFILNRTVLSGTPQPPSHETFGVYFQSEDRVIMNQPSNFEVLTGLTAFEFAFVLVLFALGVILWSRSLDPLVRFVGGLLPMVAAFLLIAVGFAAGFGNIWPGIFALFVAFALTSLYLLFRWGFDLIIELLT